METPVLKQKETERKRNGTEWNGMVKKHLLFYELYPTPPPPLISTHSVMQATLMLIMLLLGACTVLPYFAIA